MMTTVDPLLMQMKAQAEVWEKLGDNRFIFLRCYSMMTANMMMAVSAGRFNDPEWVNQLLRKFADYYFDALHRYDNQDNKTPAVWQQVHDATRHQPLHVLQGLLLGINAHINYDLVLALYDEMVPDWEELSPDKRKFRMDDHDLVNRIIGETIDSVQDNVIERKAPFMKVMDSLLGRVDEWLLSELITDWRTDVWNESCTMLAAEDDQKKEALRISLEGKVMARASQLLEF